MYCHVLMLCVKCIVMYCCMVLNVMSLVIDVMHVELVTVTAEVRSTGRVS